jgi:flagellar FliL protein
MAAKTEAAAPTATAAAAAAAAAAGSTPPTGTPAPATKASLLAPWLPVLTAIVLAPVLSWAVAEFVLLPRMQKKLAAVKAGDAAEASAAAPAGETKEESGSKGGKAGKAGKGEAPNPATYEFQNIVVNLAGTMGTRYLKTTFIVTGTDANIKTTFEGQKAKLTDITLNVLSSLSLADLEEPGAKNVLREKLVLAYNTALGRRVADQVYFSDFVVQ